MAENNNQKQQAKCPEDCVKCNMLQRNYCASQIRLTNMKLLSILVQEVSEIKTELKTIASVLAASSSQSSENLINPTETEEE